jgi:hypothetical protein
MKHPATSFLTIAAAVVLLVSNFSCQKAAETVSDNVDMMANGSDDTQADIIFSGVYNDVCGVDSTVSLTQTEVGAPEIATTLNFSKCYTVTITPTDLFTWPQTVIIDFGAGCKGKDGRVRKGKVITVFSDWLRKPGATAVTTFASYYVNDILVEGTHTIENISTTTTRILRRTINAGKLSRSDGYTINWDAGFTHSQVAGNNTPFWYWDDAFSVTGGAKGVSNYKEKVRTWERSIGEPLHRWAQCRWPDKGTVNIEVNNLNLTVDFGNGECDGFATLSFLGFSKQIVL